MNMARHDDITQEGKLVSSPGFIDFLQNNPDLSFFPQQLKATIAGEIYRADRAQMVIMPKAWHDAYGNSLVVYCQAGTHLSKAEVGHRPDMIPIRFRKRTPKLILTRWRRLEISFPSGLMMA